MTPHREGAPWASSAAEVLAHVGSSADGLSEREANRRLHRHGPNVLRTKKPRSAWAILLSQVNSILVLILAAAAAVALSFGHLVEGVAVVGVIVLNTIIGFVMELRATRSMEALRRLGRVEARVRRNGDLDVVAADHVVPGDIIVLETGDVVTTDARLIEAHRLAVDESILTGESLAVRKTTNSVQAEAPLAERTNMVFKGTVVVRGAAEAVVVATGMDSELGRIAKLVEETDDEETPLEQRLSQLGRRLVWLTAVVCVVVAAAGLYRGHTLVIVLSTAVALAVATVPEGLPVVATLALARGMWRMAKQRALVRRLSAVETLGSTDVLMTDKTGTLTENRMTVTHVVVGDELITPDARSSFTSVTSTAAALERAFTIALLCNNAEISDDGEVVGEPLEAALLEAALRAGVDPNLHDTLPELREEPFDPETRLMATFHDAREPAGATVAGASGVFVAVKGALEAILDHADTEWSAAGPVPLDEAGRKRWQEHHEKLAGEGLRVLAVASKVVDAPSAPPYASLCLVGLVGMRDPPRRDVAAVVDRCRSSGIRIVMVTGDHPRTAAQIAQAVGIGSTTADAMNGARDGAIESDIHARTTPQDKLELIRLHQNAGHIVAMIGDGVNDAPALRKADIGVAMGKRGTQVAKEAADMVLLDDRLETIVAAVYEGRVIFDNIRRFVVYLLSCNVSELLCVGGASIIGLPLPMLPMQILFLNLVTDVFPALALGACPGSPEVMARPPRPSGEPILTRRHWNQIGGYGLALMFTVLLSLAISVHVLELPERKAVTVSFVTLGVGQTFHVFNMRAAHSGRLMNEVTRNGWVWAATALCVLLIGGAVALPGLSDVLSTEDPGPAGWVVVGVLGLLPLALGWMLPKRASPAV